MTDKELWKPIPGFAGRYEASSLGRVRSVDRTEMVRSRSGKVAPRRYKGRVLKQSRRGYRGLYPYVNLRAEGKQTSMSVHLAVLLAHVGPPPFVGAEVLHGPNHDPEDNRVCNLRWGTHEENNLDRNRVQGYCGYDPEEWLRVEAEVDAQAKREGWDGLPSHKPDPFLTGETPF